MAGGHNSVNATDLTSSAILIHAQKYRRHNEWLFVIVLYIMPYEVEYDIILSMKFLIPADDSIQRGTVYHV